MSKRITIVGLQGSGKTQLAKKMIRDKVRKNKKVLVFDILGEYVKDKSLGNIDVFIPQDRIEPLLEIDTVLKNYVVEPYIYDKKKNYSLIVFDEASRYFINKLKLPSNMGFINDMARHIELDIICIARRFTQLNTDIVELSHYLYIFNQAGINDIKRLNELSIGLGDTVLTLNKYHYIEVNQFRQYSIKKPIKIMD